MPLYDLMLLLDPGAPSDRHDAILKEVTGLLEGGGTIVTTQEWGTRRMTFEIDHRPEADYHLLQFETEKGGALLEQVDHSLKIMDGVLRHRIIRQKDGNVPPAPPRAEGRYSEAPPLSEAAPAGETAGTTAGEAAAAPSEVAPEAAPPAADSIASAEGAAPSADPAVDPPAADAAPAPEPTAAVETAAPDASSLPPEEAEVAADAEAPAGDEEEAPSGPAAA